MKEREWEWEWDTNLGVLQLNSTNSVYNITSNAHVNLRVLKLSSQNSVCSYYEESNKHI